MLAMIALHATCDGFVPPNSFGLSSSSWSSASHSCRRPRPRHHQLIGDASGTSVAVTTDNYFDTVSVDLADGRDYPIYIGTGFPDEDGESHENFRRGEDCF